TVATLLVNPEESEKLALSTTEGRLMLTLRSWTDNQAVITTGSNASTLLSDSSTKPREAVVVAPPPPSRRGPVRVPQGQATVVPAPDPNAQSNRKDVVEILRGDRFEERKFEAKDKP
ncbi:MAG: Flp pilus assembly protein CpaB, partial [Myxococcales bacterium]|nr:Flp pilus assembly protein CpaB [Myxococcales bacterium]